LSAARLLTKPLADCANRRGGRSSGIARLRTTDLVGVAQLVELRVVVSAVAGSNPVAHPQEKPGKRALLADMALMAVIGAEQMRNKTCRGSSRLDPCGVVARGRSYPQESVYLSGLSFRASRATTSTSCASKTLNLVWSGRANDSRRVRGLFVLGELEWCRAAEATGGGGTATEEDRSRRPLCSHDAVFRKNGSGCQASISRNSAADRLRSRRQSRA
jgi:hypothetical protein